MFGQIAVVYVRMTAPDPTVAKRKCRAGPEVHDSSGCGHYSSLPTAGTRLNGEVLVTQAPNIRPVLVIFGDLDYSIGQLLKAPSKIRLLSSSSDNPKRCRVSSSA